MTIKRFHAYAYAERCAECGATFDEHEKPVTLSNPTGSIQQCLRTFVHQPHEWQAEFGAYFDSYCPGIEGSS